MAFNSQFGNIYCPSPPEFIQEYVLEPLQHHYRRGTRQASVVEGGLFKAYSLIKSTVRHDPSILTATKGHTSDIFPPNHLILRRRFPHSFHQKKTPVLEEEIQSLQKEIAKLKEKFLILQEIMVESVYKFDLSDGKDYRCYSI